MSNTEKPETTPTEATVESNSGGQATVYPKAEPLDLAELQQDNLHLQERKTFTPLLPADAVASALDALADWPEQWIELAEQQEPKAHAFSPALTAFKEQTLYIAKHCEKQRMDASPLIEYARELQSTYYAFRPDLPAVGNGVWVLLERLKLWLEPFEGEAGSDNNKKPPIPKDEANLLVRDYLKENPNATAAEVTNALKKHGGFSQGRLPSLPAWQQAMSKRNYEKRKRAPKPKQERILSDGMLEAIPTGDDPAEIVEAQDQADARAVAWQIILEGATPEEKLRLHETPKHEQDAMSDAWLEAQQEERLQRKREQRRQEELDENRRRTN